MSITPDLFEAYQKMERDNIILSFKGLITRELLASVYQIMESRLEELGEENRKKKKIYNILVESLQNVYHHMEDLQQGNSQGAEMPARDAMFMIVLGEDKTYYIHTGNYILTTKCELLQ